MALANYTDLQTTIATWMRRVGVTSFTANVTDIITLGEAGLNRELSAIETDASLTGTLSSRTISISSLSMDAPVALFANFYTAKETLLTPKYDGTYEQQNTDGRPRYWSIDGTNIVFDRTLDSAYTFRFRYDQKFALSVSAPTNWLLTNHPDLYLAACIVWSGAFLEDWVQAGNWKGVLEDNLPKVKSIIAKSRRGDLTVDRALQGIGRRWRDNSWVNELT